MALSDIEENILNAVRRLREPSLTQIRRSSGMCIFTVKEVSSMLVNKGYLKFVRGNRYSLTGKKAEPPLPKPEKFDRDLVKTIAIQVAEQLSRQITGKRFMVEPEKEIKIKTEFIPRIEDETFSLSSNIEKLGVKLEKEKSSKIEESVKLLKKVKKY